MEVALGGQKLGFCVRLCTYRGLFRYMRIMEKDHCRVFVYLIVLCDHPSLVSVLFAVLLSLHLVTF